MKHLLPTLCLGACLAAPTAQAEGLTWSWGVDVTSNYVFAGETQSNGNPAFQPWVEVSSNGVYFQVWASTVELVPDNWEIDFFLGYRNSLANKLSYDIGYARYTYDATGDCCGEVRLDLSYPILSNTNLRGFVAYNPENHNWHRYIDATVDLGNDFSISGRYGVNDGMNSEYWQLGGSYQITEALYADLRYHGANLGDEGLVFSMGVSF